MLAAYGISVELFDIIAFFARAGRVKPISLRSFEREHEQLVPVAWTGHKAKAKRSDVAPIG